MKNKLITLEKLPLIVATLKNSFPDIPIYEESTPEDWETIAEVWNMAISDGVDPEEYFAEACKGSKKNVIEGLSFFAHTLAQIEQDCYTAEKLN